MPGRIILTCGEPAGIGPELAPLALASGVDFAWMGDPRHLPDELDRVLRKRFDIRLPRSAMEVQ